MSLKIPRRQYADLYGPTTGDRVRLADTDLFIEIEKDFTTPGDEAKFGGGKVDSRRHGAILHGGGGGRRARSGHHECDDRGSQWNL